MLKLRKEFQSIYFSDYTISDLLFLITCILMIFAAVTYTIATSQSVPLPLRLIFFLLFAISFFKIDFFLPLISSLLIIDYFSVTLLGILPTDKKYIIYLIVIALVLNFKFCFFNFKANSTIFVFAITFLLYVFVVTWVNGIEESIFLDLVIIFTLLLGFVKPSKTIALLFGSFILSTFLLSFQGFFLRKELLDASYGTLGKLKWTDPNYMSLIIDFGILLSFYLLTVFKNNYIRFITICFLLFQFYIVLLLGSRGGLFVCFISVMYLFKKDVFSIRFIYYLIGILFVLFAFYYLGFFETIIFRFQENNLSTAGSRTQIWNRIFNALSQRDLFGLLFGSGSTSSWYAYSVVYAMRSPHNNYLEFFFDFGLVGLSLFLGLISYIYFKSKNILSQAVILFILLGALSLSPFNYEFPWLFLLFAILTYKQNSIFAHEEKQQEN